MSERHPAPSPPYSGERVGVRGRLSSCAAREIGPSPQPSPLSTGERELMHRQVQHHALFRGPLSGLLMCGDWGSTCEQIHEFPEKKSPTFLLPAALPLGTLVVVT